MMKRPGKEVLGDHIDRKSMKMTATKGSANSIYSSPFNIFVLNPEFLVKETWYMWHCSAVRYGALRIE